MPPKSVAEGAADAVWGGLKLGWKGAKASVKAAGDAVDAAKEKRAEAAASALEKQHREDFLKSRGEREGPSHESKAAAAAIYAKHAKQVRGSNTFGLSPAEAAEIKAGQGSSGPWYKPSRGTTAKAKPKPKGEKEILQEMARSIGWDNDMLDATIDGLDGDLAVAKQILQEQGAIEPSS